MAFKQHDPSSHKITTPQQAQRVDPEMYAQMLAVVPLQRAQSVARTLSSQDVQHLQRTLGNQAMGRLLSQRVQGQPIQAHTIALPDGLPAAINHGLDVSSDSVQARSFKLVQPRTQAYTQSKPEASVQRQLFTLGEMDDEPNLVTLDELISKIHGSEKLSSDEKIALSNMSKDGDEHIFNTNKHRQITIEDVRSVLHRSSLRKKQTIRKEEESSDAPQWPKVDTHKAALHPNVIAISTIKNNLKAAKADSYPFLSAGDIQKQSLEAMESLKRIKTKLEVIENIKLGYGTLLMHIMSRLAYKGSVTKANAGFLKEWALATAYLNMGIPVWQSGQSHVLQTRQDLPPHKLRESTQGLDGETNKALTDKQPGFYPFVVPLSFPIKKKIMIGPEANIKANYEPKRSEGHSALSTKDNRKRKEGNKISLVKGVLFAGEVTIGEHGEVVTWTNESGHYKVSNARAEDDTAGQITAEALVQMGFPFPIDRYRDRK